MSIKIKLGKCARFEPSKRNIKMYILGMLFIILSTIPTSLLLEGKIDYRYTIVALVIETIVFVWLETVYYPYGVKDDEPTVEEVIATQFKPRMMR